MTAGDDSHVVWVGVIGAGLAGLAAAQRIISENSRRHPETPAYRVVVLESLDRVGGRIWTHRLNGRGGIVELGAQWIHGQIGNPLYEYCQERNLLAVDVGDERSGQYMTEDGERIPPQLVDRVISRLANAKDHLFQETSVKSVGSLLTEEMSTLLKESTIKTEQEMIRSLCEWYKVFEIIDNACSNLDNLSIQGYSDWIDFPGVKLGNLKNGYESVINELIQCLDKDSLKLNTKVESIDYSDAKVKIKTNNEDFIFDFVILTVSIGVLKSREISFNPRLPQIRQSLFDAHGYGTINKIFLSFDEIFWNDQHNRSTRDEQSDSFFALKLVWKNRRQQDFPDWVYDMTGFDSVRGQDNMIMGWIGGEGAEKVEKESDEDVGRICAKIIGLFLGKTDIPQPTSVLMTRWFSNPSFRGSYSHQTIQSDALSSYRDMTFQPLLDDKMTPRVYFAGEATNKHFYSSTHGAFTSGQKVAEDILKITQRFY